VATVWYEGIEELLKVSADLAGAGPKASAMAVVALNKTGADIERDSKATVPVDTGNLKASISRTTATVKALSVEVGPTASYGGYVEWGIEAEWSSPQPYMGPAFDTHVVAFQAAIASIASRPPI
jgi:HK97 gp10 family phage protein